MAQLASILFGGAFTVCSAYGLGLFSTRRLRLPNCIALAVGAALTLAGVRRSVTPELRLLAVGSALGLAGIDVVYVRRRRISRVYLLDAIAELALVAAWLFASARGRARS